MLIKTLCAASHILVSQGYGWKISGEAPSEKKSMLLGAPHTSNLDYFLTLALIHHLGLPLKYLIKDNLFKGPMAWLLKSLGGIPVDRKKTNNLVESMIATIEKQDEILMGVLPEGTRKYTDYWKSGFYHIAYGAGIPIYPVKIDGTNKHVEIGSRMTLSGDIEKDMSQLAEFFKGIKGVKPENSGPVRIRPRTQH